MDGDIDNVGDEAEGRQGRMKEEGVEAALVSIIWRKYHKSMRYIFAKRVKRMGSVHWHSFGVFLSVRTPSILEGSRVNYSMVVQRDCPKRNTIFKP